MNRRNFRRKYRLRKWIISIIIIGLLGWAVYDFVLKKPEADFGDLSENNEGQEGELGLEQGKLAPDFELETIDGELVSLSDYRGQKVILNFWASWCGPCRAEMPDMQKFYSEYGDDIAILAVNLRETERNDDNVRDFVEEYDVTFPVLSDVSTAVANIYQARQLPTSYLIHSDGTIHNKAVGPLNYESMVREFNEMH